MRLINDDCIKAMNELIDENVQVDMVLTDLPYGTTQCKWDNIIPFEDMWNLIHHISYDSSPIILFGNEPFSSHLRLSNLKEYKYDIIWDKIIRTGHLNAKKQPLRQYENIMVFYNKQPCYNPIKWLGKEVVHDKKTTKLNNNIYGKHHATTPEKTKWKYPTNVVKINARSNECNGQNRVHPTQKPVELLEYLIKTYTNEDDLVLDFTMGSGSTGVACRNLNRDFIGIELDKNYYDIACKRINNYQEKLV